MFQPETEDMLPRMAPKPSVSSLPGGTATEPTIRPQVPEVSILFGQQQGGNLQTQTQTQNFQPTQQTTTYAAWKKQMLPKVTFPSNLTQEMTNGREAIGNNQNNLLQDSNAPRSNLYPMRTSAATVTPAISSNGNVNAYMGNSAAAPFVISANDRPNSYVGNSAAGTNATYRNGLESCGIYQPSQQQQTQIYRKSMEITSPPIQSYSSPRDVLTICAGTQTDALSPPNKGLQNISPTNMASKEDVEDLKQIVQEIRHNQICLMQMMEKFICNQPLTTKERPESKDVAIQVYSDTKEPASMGKAYGSDGGQTCLPAPKNKVIQQLKQSPNILQTPKGKPMAQSTTYRPNSPQSNRLQEYQQVPPAPTPAIQQQAPNNYPQWNNNLALALPKPTTDKSLMMNELALKYLPNEKLAELLNELNVGSAPAQKQTAEAITPLRNIENFERGPSDISNASYKYLKKYRLLPEDQVDGRENENPHDGNTPTNQQYGIVRSPGQQRQSPVFTPQKSNSPYQQTPLGRLPQSPLVRGDITPILKNNMLDLENIRHQPKFL